MGKLDKLARKRATARKAKKAEADAAAVSAAAAAAVIAASDTAAVPAATSGPGIATCRTYAAIVAGGTAVSVLSTSVNAAVVASTSSPVIRSSKKHKSSAAAVAPADISARAGDAFPSAVTMYLKIPKPSATPVVVRTSRYPSRGIAGRKSSIAVGASTNSVPKKDTNTKLSAKQKDAIADKHDEP